MKTTFRTSARRVLGAALAFAAVSASASAQSYTTYGSGCPAAGPPVLSNSGLPVLGSTFSVDLSSAPPNASALLLFGASDQFINGLPLPLDLGAFGMPGCDLLTSIEIVTAHVTDAAGTASASIAVPPVPGLAGVVFHNQWAVSLFRSDAAWSNGGRGTIDNLPPTSIGTFSPSSGPVGTIVTVRVTNAGTNDPDDLCLRVMEPMSGALSLFRVQSIVHDPGTGEDVLTARLETAVPGGGPVGGRGHLGMMRGAGSQPPASASGVLSAPPARWSWEGHGLAGNGAMGGSFVPVPDPNRVTISFQQVGNALIATLPLDPFATGTPATAYGVGRLITSDVHGDIAGCPGPASWHFDDFLGAVAVVQPGGASAAQVAADHAPQIQEAFDNGIGPGKVSVTATTHAGLPAIRVEPAGGGCTLLGGGGSIILQ